MFVRKRFMQYFARSHLATEYGRWEYDSVANNRGTMKRRTLLSAGAGAMMLAPHLKGSLAVASEPGRARELYGLLGKLPPRDRTAVRRYLRERLAYLD